MAAAPSPPFAPSPARRRTNSSSCIHPRVLLVSELPYTTSLEMPPPLLPLAPTAAPEHLLLLSYASSDWLQPATQTRRHQKGTQGPSMDGLCRHHRSRSSPDPVTSASDPPAPSRSGSSPPQAASPSPETPCKFLPMPPLRPLHHVVHVFPALDRMPCRAAGQVPQPTDRSHLLVVPSPELLCFTYRAAVASRRPRPLLRAASSFSARTPAPA